MLVLSRKQGEKIDVAGGYTIGGVTIVVKKIKHGCVQLGIAAPKEMEIARDDLGQAKKRGSREAVSPAAHVGHQPPIADGLFAPSPREGGNAA